MKVNAMFYSVICFAVLLLCITPLSTYAQQGTASGAGGIPLLLSDHPGVDEIDAQSAARLIATEFRKLGIRVEDPAYETPTTAGRYRITLHRLGEKMLVHLSQETANGATLMERQLWITRIEEMIQVAPRLVDAIVHDKPIESTLDMAGTTEQEAAAPQKMASRSLIRIGPCGVFLPRIDIPVQLGGEISWSYETPSYAVGTEIRGSTSSDDALHRFSFAVWSIGGRYFFTQRNISPYIGGGLSYIGVTLFESGEFSIFDSSTLDVAFEGLGAYIAGGIEMLRFTKSRLTLELRIDRPFSPAEGSAHIGFFQVEAQEQDVMPISFGIFYSRHFVLW